MKKGIELQELASTLEEQLKTKRDYIVSGDAISVAMVDRLCLAGNRTFGMTETFHSQVAARLQIPKQYYDRMRQQAPELYRRSVNTWFGLSGDRRMVRTLDGNARALLSDRYRPIDNHDLASVILPRMGQLGLSIESCNLSETRMYIKAVNARLTGEVTVGDVVQAGISISNSEVGCGSVRIEPLVYRLSCRNGMIVAERSMVKYHIGRLFDGKMGDGAAEFFKDSTRAADDRAFLMKVRDILDGAFKPEMFEDMVNTFRAAADRKITGNPVRVVEVTANRLGLSVDDQGGILRHLIDGGDLSQWGLTNALTAYSQDVEDYEKATDLERAGGQIIDLTNGAWAEIASAN